MHAERGLTEAGGHHHRSLAADDRGDPGVGAEMAARPVPTALSRQIQDDELAHWP